MQEIGDRRYAGLDDRVQPPESPHAWSKTSSPSDRSPRCSDLARDRWESVAPLVPGPAGADRLGRRRRGSDPTPGRPDAARPLDDLEDLPPLRGLGVARPLGSAAARRAARPD